MKRKTNREKFDAAVAAANRKYNDERDTAYMKVIKRIKALRKKYRVRT